MCSPRTVASVPRILVASCVFDVRRRTTSPFAAGVAPVEGGELGLSAYLDKVAKEKRDLAVRIPLARSLGLKPGDRPSFGEFLTRIVDLDPWVMDRHFTPQYVNVLSDYVTPDFVGHLEDMASVEESLGGQRVPTTAHSPHQTGASQRIREFYGKDEVSPFG